VPDDHDEPKPDDEPTAPEDAAGEGAGEDPGPALPSEDRFRPETIAARVERIGEESEIDRIARLEEQKLLERKAQNKRKRGLDASASKRLAKIGETKVKRPSAVADAYIAEADPLMERMRRARAWIVSHRPVFAAMVGVAVVGVGGTLGWVSLQNKRQGDASALLAQALGDQHGHVSDKEDDDDEARARPLYPTFKSGAERRSAALAKYREVEAKYAGTGAAILARLSEAGLLLDDDDAKGAKLAYEDVKGSPLALADAEVRGRALEGIGFANELLAASDADRKSAHLDDALAAFKALGQLDVNGFKELGTYHEARVEEAKGDKAKATELLKDVHQRITAGGAGHPFPYLESVVEDRLREIDPGALPPKIPKRGGGAGPGGADMNSPQVQELIRQLQQQQQQQQRGGASSPAPGPSPASPPQ
jgi:hypothetical protein